MNDVQKYLVDEELEHYRDGWITRREFLRRSSLLGIASAAAAAMARAVAVVPVVHGQPQESPFHVAEDDPSVTTNTMWITSDDGAQLLVYLAWPVGAAMNNGLPGVAVCHENRGLNLHIQDVARRYAKQGYVAIAPDLPSRFGTPTSELSADDITAAFGRLNARQNPRDFVAALDVLKQHPAVDGSKLAATGFCFGGGVIWELTTLYPGLGAAAPFYGARPPADGVPNIKAAVLGVFGELDERINAGMETLGPDLNAAGVTYQFKIYRDSPHAFHNDTGASYRRDTAVEAYTDTLNWFAQHLGLPAPTMA